MELKELFDDKYQILAVVESGACPALEFLEGGEDSTEASRIGLLEMLMYVAERGLQNTPAKWTHEVDKSRGIYEFVKGDLRLFFFKGANRQITVCTVGVIKKGQKADKSSVNKSAKMKSEYFAASATNTIKVIKDEDN